MTRLVTVFGLMAFGQALTLAGEPGAGAAADARARKLLSAAAELASDGKHAEAEKACLEALALSPSPPLAVQASAQLAEVYCNLEKYDKAQDCLARAEEGLKKAGGPGIQAKVLYLRAVLACQKADLKGCLEQLRRAIASSEEAILWANDNRASHFADIMLLGEDSAVRREFLEMTDLAHYDKELRESIKAKCQQAAKEGKRVLLDFYGGW